MSRQGSTRNGTLEGGRWMCVSSLLLIVALGASAARAATVSYKEGDGKGLVSESHESTVNGEAGNTGTNYSTDTLCIVDQDQHQHCLVKFPNIFGPGADQIPLGSRVVSATLIMYVANDGTECPIVHQVVEGWTESEVTWDDRMTGTAWTDAGADGSTSRKAASEGVIPCGTAGSYESLDVTTSVQNWSDGEPNEGWVFLNAANNDGIDFRTSEHGTQSRYPELQVTFAQPVFYSVGTNTADLKSGTPTLEISGGVATFTTPQPDHVGVGDEVTYNGGTRAFISGRVSSTVYTLTDRLGVPPSDIGPGIAVDSIMRAFNDLKTAAEDSDTGSFLGFSDLVANDIQLNWPCYADGPDPSVYVRIEEPWITGPNHYIRAYTPTDPSEVGRSQRHTGVAGTGYRIAPVTSDPGFGGWFNLLLVSTDNGYVRVEGLELDGSGVSNAENFRGLMANEGASSQDVWFTHNIVHDIVNSNFDDSDRSETFGIYVDHSLNTRVANNIIYNIISVSAFSQSGSHGIEVKQPAQVHWIYNNTIHNVRVLNSPEPAYGIFDDGGGTAHVRNNYVGLVEHVPGGTAQGFNGPFLSESNNVSADGTAGGANSQTGQSSYAGYFQSVSPGTEDFHIIGDSSALWGSDGFDLDTDPNLPVTDDIDGQSRNATTPDIGADEYAAPMVFYSVGTSTADLSTGSPNIAISSGLATLSAGQTNDVGVGDEITYDSMSKTVYISAVVSPTQFRVLSADGTLPTDVAGPGLGVDSIRRAFNSVSSAATNSRLAGYLGNGDLTAIGRRVTWICYDDGAFTVGSTTTIGVGGGGYTTDAGHYITLTVAGASQVATGNSQRHTGIAGTGARLEASAGGLMVLDVQPPFTRVEWLEIDGNDHASVDGVQVDGTADQSLVKQLLIHNVTGDGINVITGGDRTTIRNIIVYDYGGDGVHVSGFDTLVANSSFYLGRTSPASNSVQTDTGPTATARVYNVLAVGPQTDFHANGGSTLELYNTITTDGSACTYDVSGSCLTGVQPEGEFQSLSGTINLHLRAGAQAIDFGQTLSSFSDDIDGQRRPLAASFDAGADESGLSAATTHYRSIGTAPDLVNQGTITVTAGSTTVTKVGGTGWQAANRGRGDVLIVNGTDQYMIQSVGSNDALTLASIPTTGYIGGTYTIARQFGTLQAWEDCIDGQGGSPPPAGPCFYFPAPTSSLVADGRAEVGIAYNDSAVPADPDFTDRLVISGMTTDADHPVTLTADGPNRHHGIAGAGVLIDCSACIAGNDEVEIFNVSNVTIEWLELAGFGGVASVDAAIKVRQTAANVLLDRLLLHDNANGVRLSDTAGKNVTVRNSFIYANQFNGVEADEAANDYLTVENTTFYNNGENGVDVGNTPTANVVVRNTISMGNAVEDYDSSLGGPTASYSIDSDGSLPACVGCLASRAATDVPTASASFVVFTSLTPGSEDLHLQSSPVNDAVDTGMSLALSSGFASDIDADSRPGGVAWDMGADEFSATTSVELLGFLASPGDRAVIVSWQTGTELNNLGFHLYRAIAPDGLWTRITRAVIPGLGSSPEGASYSFRDTGLENDIAYFYRLEDIDSTSGSTFHGPVSATPSASEGEAEGEATREGESDGESPESNVSPDRTTYGSPGKPQLRVLSRNSRAMVVELTTPGFVATDTPAGVRVSVRGFDARRHPEHPALPLKRALLNGIVGRHARVVWAREKKVSSFPELVPAAVGSPEVFVGSDGTVQPRRREMEFAAVDGVHPLSAARIAGDAFIGKNKKLALELSPLRYDAASRTLLLARKLQVKIAFDRQAGAEDGSGSEGARPPSSTNRQGGQVLAYLHTLEKGLHAVPYEALGLGTPVSQKALRLSFLGQTVPHRVQPAAKKRFGPGSVLYFYAAHEASSLDHSSETTYALEQGPGGIPMKALPGSLKGLKPVSQAPSSVARFETNRFYQAGLLDAPDIWLWDFVVGGMSKSFPFVLPGLDLSAPGPVQLQVVLQGASEAEIDGEHHLSVSVNGVPLGETTFDGKLAHVFTTTAPVSALLEGENTLEVTNLGDTGAYSFVFLDRFSLVHPRTRTLRNGRFDGAFSQKGRVSLPAVARYGMDVTDPASPKWVKLHKVRSRVHFKALPGHRYVVASKGGLLSPRVSRPLETGLREDWNQADYVLIAPAEYLEAAEPLLERRESQGLKTRAVSFEEIVSQFGYGRPSAAAIRDFLAYAYHHWEAPRLRYVLLLGDASYDPRNFTGFSKGSPLPALWAKTSYLVTSSDPLIAAVNGEDGLADVAIGRLPALTVEEAEALVRKVLDWEDGGQDLEGKAILVADNPDIAGDFEADIADIRESFLHSRETQTIHLRDHGANTRTQVLNALDQGASLLSYVGHGGPAVWASENVLNSWDPPKLLGQTEQPLMLTFNCLNGYFVAPNYDSLAEAFLKAEGKGTIGAFSPSGLSLDGPAHRFHRAVMDEFVNGDHERLGDAILAAQAAYAETGLMPELLAVYHLLADPGMEVR